MRILRIEDSRKPNGIEIRGLMGNAEYEQLVGNLDNLMVVATRTITERATVTLTGARHSAAKYLLFPVRLRRQFKTDEFDFEKLLCGSLRYKDKLYIVYEVPRKV